MGCLTSKRIFFFFFSSMQEEGEITWNTMVTQTYELTEECLETNYYGAKRMVEALNTLLQLSHSPTIVNVSSFMGKLKVSETIICIF